MKKFLISIAIIVTSGFAVASPAIISTPVFAAKKECTCKDAKGNDLLDEHGRPLRGERPENALLGDSVCECGHGEAVMGILRLIVRILTVGVAVLAAMGITIVGIQYLTAGGNEEQAKKAKRRLLEIVIGVIAYAMGYALLSFLIPNFSGF